MTRRRLTIFVNHVESADSDDDDDHDYGNDGSRQHRDASEIDDGSRRL